MGCELLALCLNTRDGCCCPFLTACHLILHKVATNHHRICASPSAPLLLSPCQLRQLSSFWLSLPPAALCARALLGPFSLLGDRRASFYTALQGLRADRWGPRLDGMDGWIDGWMDGWIDGWMDL